MNWKQLVLDVGAAEAEAVEAALLAAGAAAVTLTDRADQPLLEPAPGELPLWQEVRLSGLFDAELDSRATVAAVAAALERPLPDHRWQALEARDWERAWMDDFHPLRFGRRLWVVPSWRDAPEPGAVNLALDPGLAFGTGTHPTTALCLEWLDGAPLAGRTLLDYGCGSGILAIAGLLLGAEEALAVDHDPQALLATTDNAARNRVPAQRLRALTPEALAADDQADVLVANILAGPLIELAPTLCRHLRPGGRFALSGILAEQADEVAAAYSHECELDAPAVRDGWVRLSGRRRRAS